MKKNEFVPVFMAALALMLACGGDGGTVSPPARETSAASQNERAAPASQAFDCKHFTMTVAEGWQAGPLTFGMVNVLPRGKISPGLYFKFEGDGNAAGTAEASIQSMIRQYGGTPMTSTLIAGAGFKTTTYTYSGMTQTMHVAFRNGTKISITIEGKEAKDDPAIRAMLGSVILK